MLKIIIVDGLGSQAFIPLPNYSTFFAKKYVKRRIELMNSRIKDAYKVEEKNYIFGKLRYKLNPYLYRFFKFTI